MIVVNLGAQGPGGAIVLPVEGPTHKGMWEQGDVGGAKSCEEKDSPAGMWTFEPVS